MPPCAFTRARTCPCRQTMWRQVQGRGGGAGSVRRLRLQARVIVGFEGKGDSIELSDCLLHFPLLFSCHCFFLSAREISQDPASLLARSVLPRVLHPLPIWDRTRLSIAVCRRFSHGFFRREGVEPSLSPIQPQPSWRRSLVIVLAWRHHPSRDTVRQRPPSQVPTHRPPCHARKRGGDTRGPHYTSDLLPTPGRARPDIHPSSHTGQHNVHSHCGAIQTTVTVAVACLLCTRHSPSRRGTWRQAFGDRHSDDTGPHLLRPNFHSRGAHQG